VAAFRPCHGDGCLCHHLHLGIAVEAFALVNGMGRARGLLSLGGQLECNLEPQQA
jgi:hypothetical protein